jgi:F-type H+-transporting ATPase subunit a
MGEHGTWFDYLNRIPAWKSLDHKLQELLGRSWEWQMFGPSGWTLTHVLITCLVVLIIGFGSLAFYRGLSSKDKGLVPPRQMNVRNAFEVIAESLYGFVEGGMGEKQARRFYPLIGGLFIFILFNNLFALIPGFSAPTDSLKTNVGIALLVFLLTHVYGVKEHGLAYFKHFLGPSPALIPLMLPIELVSHIARPVSLSVRLMGNMMADHKVVMSFFALVPILIPLPFLLLGLLVCLIQAVVFCTLAMVYIGMSLEHEEH